MYKNINVEAEHNELILENSNGDKVIIPANKRNWVKQKLSEGCHGCIDSLVETLPVVNNYAQDGTVFPNEKQPIVLITPSGRKVETDTDSDFYRAHYNSKLIGKQNEDKSWNLTDEIYQGKPLPEIVVTSKIQPNTFTDYNNQFNKNNPKDKFLQAKQEEHNKEFYSAPLWAQQAVGGYNDKRKQNDLNRDNEEYKKLQNDFIAEKLLKRTPFEGIDNRLKWMEKFSPKELETIKNSKYANEIEPSIWSKFEQGLLSIGNMGSPVQFKSKGLSQEEAKKEDNPLNILQPLSIPSKMVQSAYKDNYSFKDALKGKQNNANIVEDIITDPLNLVGLGIWGKLKYANKFKNLDEAYQSVKGLSKEEALNKLGNADNIINKGLDIHDVRLKYHNNQILDFDEHALLNLEGKGNVVNYRKTSTKDILGRTQIDDAKEATIDMNKKNIEELLFGREQEKVVEKTNNIIDIENVKKDNFNYQEQNINTKSKIDWSPDDFIIHNVTPYERTATTREADKWISDWYTHPETKKKFIDYGGSEDEWKIVQNSLENPILSSSNWGKNRPRGLYMKVLDKASIPLNETTDIAIHEGIHKTKIALEKKNTILPKMYNDLVDAVKEVPSEVYPELGRLRYNLKLKPTDKLTLEQLDKGLKTISDGYSIKMKIKDKNKLLDILNKAPAILPFYLYLNNQNKSK